MFADLFLSFQSCFKEKKSTLCQHKCLGNEAKKKDLAKSCLRFSENDPHFRASDEVMCCAKDRYVDTSALLSLKQNCENDQADQSRKSSNERKVKKELFQYCLRKQRTKQSMSDGDLSRYARPSLISLSEIPSDQMQHIPGFENIYISTSSLSSPRKMFSPNSKERRFHMFGSLGRSFKLRQLSNPSIKANSFQNAVSLAPLSQANSAKACSPIKFPPAFSPLKSSNQEVVDNTFQEFLSLTGTV